MSILSAILVIVCRTKLVFELEQEFDGSNPYMKFGKNLIINDWVRVTTTADIDRRRPLCRPSWLSDVGQNPYSNLNERLMEAIHVWNLDEIWLKNDWVRVTTTADIDMWRPFCRPSWLSEVGQNPYSNLNERLMEAIHIWKLEEIRLKMTELEWSRQRILICGGHFVGHLGYRNSDKTRIQTWTRGWWKQSIYEIWKNPIKNDWVRVTMTADIDMWGPFCRPSWLSDAGQNLYLNLNKRLMEAIHIWNLEEIWQKMSELEWPRTDRQMDKSKTIELHRAPPTFFGGALKIFTILHSKYLFI